MTTYLWLALCFVKKLPACNREVFALLLLYMLDVSPDLRQGYLWSEASEENTQIPSRRMCHHQMPSFDADQEHPILSTTVCCDCRLQSDASEEES